MWLEDFVPSEWADTWSKSAEISEKFREAVKKSTSWIKRVQKDEKKAKKFDNLLASFLVQIIKDKKYDFLLESLFKNLDIWYNSNFLIWILSLIYQPIHIKIRELSKKQKFVFNYTISQDIINFDDNNLDENIKIRINIWIEDIIDIISIEYSFLQLQKLKELLSNNNSKKQIVSFCAKIFKFFFQELNIDINEKKSNNYMDFILWEIFKKINSIEIEEI